MGRIKLFWPSFIAAMLLGVNILQDLVNYQTLPFGVWILLVGVVIQIYVLYSELEKVNNSLPNIVAEPRIDIRPVQSIETTTTTNTSTTHVNGVEVLEEKKECFFALVDLYNRPHDPTPNSVAKSVSALITYYDKDGKIRISEKGISGRWWSISEVRLGEDRREKEKTDIEPNTQPAILALACMGVRESAIYAYNNENHDFKDFKKQEFSLGLSNYHIHVVLAGINLKRTEFWFEVWRDTNSGKLDVKLIKGLSNTVSQPSRT